MFIHTSTELHRMINFRIMRRALSASLSLPRSSPSFIFFCFWLLLCSLESTAQNATLDPVEAQALNSMFGKWGIGNLNMWNISGEPCTGSAINGTAFEDAYNNPSITCDCSYNGGTTCHVAKLRVYALNKKGEIPEELAALTYLTFFKIDQNYFSGPLPSFIGNLTKLTSLSVAYNSLSGTIPKEIGYLKELDVLSLGPNNFSGTLPPELGGLPKLTQLYINSCGAGGEIPETFANLLNLQILAASDSPFSGKIPDFIGNLTALTSMRLEGNSFEGPIPSSFSKLVSMRSLRITDLYNVSSSLDFIRDLKELRDLSLRNALVSGTIPSFIGEFEYLQRLDLSYNNLTGEVPSSLFNSSDLTDLFLGNNSLSGSLPTQKSGQLQTIDLSYNQLSGSFPSWVNSDLQLNLVANNFIFDSSNSSDFQGLDCLQRNFPCNRNFPLYANFSVKCGGPEIRTSDGRVYEADNSSLGTATYYITNSKKWAVGNVGLYAERSGSSYLENNTHQISNTSSPELFNTSRVSPGSLRYYGLGLENGNYTVTMEFAETVFKSRSTETWESLGRRVFDIYIQGRLQLKDFDITKEAGGVDRALEKKFNATVSENYIEIHLFWAGKGTCCIPVQGYYGPSISALSVVSDFLPSVSGIPSNPTSEKNNTGLIVGVVVGVGSLIFLLICAVLYIKLRASNANRDEELFGMGPIPNTFTYAELRAATEDFSPANKLGEGGFGPVYKGKLNDERAVAVKQLSVASHQGKDQFITEIATISAVQHRNLVKLYGCCIEGDKQLLVYEYLENKSLDQALFGKNDSHLDWQTRFKICLGTARGLVYLHEQSRPRIVHRDVKASNILLDAELCPKISDFGLAKLYDDKKTHISTRVAGTIGYLAPEYAMRGHLTEKADVFGFGVVALEILSGRSNADDSLDTEKIYLLEWAWSLRESNRILELVDPALTAFDEDEAQRVIGVALLCTQASPSLRPTMSRALAMLAGDIELSAVTAKPSYLTDWDFKDISSGLLDMEEDTPITVTSMNGSAPTPGRYDDDEASYGVRTPANPAEPMLREVIGDGR